MKKISIVLSMVMVFCMVSIASASVLTFDLTNYDYNSYEVFSQDYGDRVIATSDAVGSYLEGNGFTPNITIDYLTVSFNPGMDAWESGFGDLTNVANSSHQSNGVEIKFTADAGYEVTINSFDLAKYHSYTTINTIEILDENRELVWSADSLAVDSVTHTSYMPDITGSELTICFGDGWNIGIDNINFDQSSVVPIPGAIWLLGSGLIGLIAFRKRN